MNYDLVMPGMSGRELMEEIGKLSPETRRCVSHHVALKLVPASPVSSPSPGKFAVNTAQSCSVIFTRLAKRP